MEFKKIRVRRQIRLLLIISVVLFVGLLAGKTEVKAAFCGVDQGYDASIGVNAKKCQWQYGIGYVCENNGTWLCNGTYPCDTAGGTDANCHWYGHYSSTTPSDCYVNVYCTNVSTAQAFNDCTIPADKSSCSLKRAGETGGCWVYGGATPTPEPTTPPAVNGVCSNPDTHYNCTAGTSANNVSGTSTWTWTCNGLYGGTNASCSENKPINGVCSNPDTHYICTAGTSANHVSGTSTWTWTCNGLYGGTNASCSENKPINGVCSNPDTHYICTAGTSANHVSGTSTWTWTCNGLYGGTNASCSENKPIDPWWQVVDGDVQTNGDLRSDVPSIGSLYFDVAGGGGYPGVPAYGGSTDLTNTNVSEKGWLAKSPYVIANNRVYNYDFFESLIPAETVNKFKLIPSSPVTGGSFEAGGTLDPTTGYYWYKYSSSLPLTISSAINLTGSTRKVILLVDSPNLNINGSINYTAGTGFFMAIVKGNIKVSSTVGDSATADLQGYYLADSSFVTGTGNKQLHVKGAVAGLEGITLQRDLGAAANADTPAEIFEYSPADVFLYPFKLGVRRMSWKEVAP